MRDLPLFSLYPFRVISIASGRNCGDVWGHWTRNFVQGHLHFICCPSLSQDMPTTRCCRYRSVCSVLFHL